MFESHLHSFFPCVYATNSMYKEGHLFRFAFFQFLGIKKKINFIYLFLIFTVWAMRVFVAAHGLSLVAPWHVESLFPNQGSNLNHWTTRKALKN